MIMFRAAIAGYLLGAAALAATPAFNARRADFQ